MGYSASFRNMVLTLPILGAAMHVSASRPAAVTNCAGVAQTVVFTATASFLDSFTSQLLSFDAVLNDGKVSLYWSTGTEINSRFFIVERSKDSKSWAEILKTGGASQNNGMIEYADADYSPLKGTSYYRLKQTDEKGSCTYTYPQMVVVKNNDLSATDPDLFFTGYGNEEVLVLVRDLKGKEFYSKVYLAGKEDHLKAVTLDHYLAAGDYFVVASSEERVVSRRIVVE